MTDKNTIEKCFSKGSETYNNQALIQKKIAAKLSYLLLKLGFEKFEQILEIGCGTGFLSQQMLSNFQISNYYINDLVNKSFDEIKTFAQDYSCNNIEFIKGDAETLNFPANLNGIVSTSTFQWFNFFEEFILKMKSLLNSNGILAFSTFGPKNYKEIKCTLNVGLDYKTLENIIRILEPNYKILHSEEWIEQKEFDTPIDVLKHMKLTGVNGLKTRFLGKERLHKFNNDYLRLFSNTNNKVTLTYNPIIVIAKLK